jgi:hypothetical protein
LAYSNQDTLVNVWDCIPRCWSKQTFACNVLSLLKNKPSRKLFIHMAKHLYVKE